MQANIFNVHIVSTDVAIDWGNDACPYILSNVLRDTPRHIAVGKGSKPYHIHHFIKLAAKVATKWERRRIPPTHEVLSSSLGKVFLSKKNPNACDHFALLLRLLF